MVFKRAISLTLALMLMCHCAALLRSFLLRSSSFGGQVCDSGKFGFVGQAECRAGQRAVLSCQLLVPSKSKELTTRNRELATALRPRAAGERKLLGGSTPSDDFINRVLTDQAREAGISSKQRGRIRRIVAYFWDHEGWASKWDLVGASDSTDITLLTDLKKVDFERLKTESRACKKPIPLYFQYGSQKERLLRVIGIVESLGWRASVHEIGDCLGLPPSNMGGIKAVFSNCQNSRELVDFLNDVNYNRWLARKLSLEIFYVKGANLIKEAQGRLINALEAFDGRATASDLAKILEITPTNVCKIWKRLKSNMAELNKKRRAQGLIPLIGVIPEQTKRAEDRIIQALEELGGVSELSEIIARTGQDKDVARRVANRMSFALINEIRVKKGLSPLFIMPRSNEQYLRMLFNNGARMQKNSEAAATAQAMRLWQRKRFGSRGAKDFEKRTVPFAYAVVYGNNGNGLAKKRSASDRDWADNIYQRLLEVIANHAEQKGLYAAPETRRGNAKENQALINYYRIAVPRALNVSRKELASVDVMRINLLVLDDIGNGNGGQNGSRRNSRAIRPEEEENMQVFLANLDKALEQLSAGGRGICFSRGSIIPNRLHRVEVAYTKYVDICVREKERFERAKAGVIELTLATLKAAESAI